MEQFESEKTRNIESALLIQDADYFICFFDKLLVKGTFQGKIEEIAYLLGKSTSYEINEKRIELSYVDKETLEHSCVCITKANFDRSEDSLVLNIYTRVNATHKMASVFDFRANEVTYDGKEFKFIGDKKETREVTLYNKGILRVDFPGGLFQY